MNRFSDGYNNNWGVKDSLYIKKVELDSNVSRFNNDRENGGCLQFAAPSSLAPNLQFYSCAPQSCHFEQDQIANCNCEIVALQAQLKQNASEVSDREF